MHACSYCTCLFVRHGRFTDDNQSESMPIFSTNDTSHLYPASARKNLNGSGGSSEKDPGTGVGAIMGVARKVTDPNRVVAVGGIGVDIDLVLECPTWALM